MPRTRRIALFYLLILSLPGALVHCDETASTDGALTRSLLPELHLLEPVWASPVSWRESTVLLQQGEGAPLVGRLAFEAAEIIAVTSADGARTFVAGQDFQLGEDRRTLLFASDAPVPFIKQSDLFPSTGAPDSYQHRAGHPDQSLLYHKGSWFHERQLEVTYRRAETNWPGEPPSWDEGGLPRTLARLRAGQTLRIGVSGDSIAEGGDASGLHMAPPHMPAFPELVAAQLESSYSSEIVLRNRAVGGWSIANGNDDLDNLLDENPDLIIVAYGMNDVGRRDPEWFRAQVETFVSRVRAANPAIEMILVAPMLGNAEWVHTPRDMFARYRDVLQALTGPGIVLADLTSVWEVLLRHKHDLDLIGNGLNHPNDCGHRLYAQTILSCLVPTPSSQTLSRLRAGEPVRICCFGDSVTGLYYHTGGNRAYTDMLGLALNRAFPDAKIETINAGVSGHTTVDGLGRMERDVLQHNPALVTVMFGLNDMARVPLDQYRANLETIIDRCHAIGADVLLCTPNDVITTTGRPVEKLVQYCDAVREVGRARHVAVCDCYNDMEALRGVDALAWRLLMSDEIHPNMDGHQRIAEALTRSITGQHVSLADVDPPTPAIARTLSRLAAKQSIKILAMPPLDELIEPVLKGAYPDAMLEITPWPTDDKSLADIELDAKARVREFRPDLVLIAVPSSAGFESQESFIHSYIWIMNWSLSFGAQEWDCVVVHPSLSDPDHADADYDPLIRHLVRGQDLTLVDRPANDQRPAGEILIDWFRGQRP
ncbi:MAG: SGNH/GDSL hydrolase family protein [Planctomycetaceae bacterium]|nr:SGNH/GDSL hydrolase family protein [Planctomycetaceae bacterium]